MRNTLDGGVISGILANRNYVLIYLKIPYMTYQERRNRYGNRTSQEAVTTDRK